MLISAKNDSAVLTFVFSAAVIGAEEAFYLMIPETHYLALFKYMNIMYGADTGSFLSDYINISLMGYPVNSHLLFIILWAALTSVGIFFIINYFESYYPERGKKSIIIKIKYGGRHTVLFLHELYKMLIPGKSLYVIVLAIIFTFWWNPSINIQFDSIDDVYYKEYMDKLYGPLDQDKIIFIDEEKKAYEQLSNDIDAAVESGKSEVYIEIKYKDMLDRQEAFNMVLNHLSYLKTVKNGWFFYENGYNILTDRNNYANRDVIQAIIYIILLIAFSFEIYGLDNRYSEVKIVRTTYNGRKKIDRIKAILGIVNTIIAFCLVYIIHTVRVFDAYGTGGIYASAASIKNLSSMPSSMLLLHYLLLIMLMRFAGGINLWW